MGKIRKFLLVGAAISFAACVNNISEKEVEVGDVPIHFKVHVKKPSTRITESTFEPGDQMGLYALINGRNLTEERYFTNEKLTVAEESELISARPLFYPKDNTSLDFISYYPYQQTDIADGETTLKVGIRTTQNKDADYENSLFLTATATDVSSETEEVKLAYTHRFVKLNLTIVPEDGESVDELLASDPYVVACGFYTQADYDFADGELKNLDGISHNIVTHGTWKKTSDGKGIEGKTVIVMPQKTASENQYFTIEYNGVVYNCPFPKAQTEIFTGTSYKIKISTKELQEKLFQGVIASINPWTVEEEDKLTTDEGENTAIHLASLSFRTSNVYRVYKGGSAVAEICKEYLAGSLNATAITIYPMKNNDEADWADGMILQLVDGEGAVCGSELTWKSTEGVSEYVHGAGSQTPIETVYIDDNNQIVTERPATPAVISIVAHTLADVRSGGIVHYALVKLGTQCWMREELKAAHLADGTKLPNLVSDPNDERIGYYQQSGKSAIFYPGETLLNKELASEGWEIPSAADFEQLKTYLDGEASLLKAGTWKAKTEGEEVEQVNNKAQFFAYPIGGWNGEKVILEGATVAYWAKGGTDKEGQPLPLVPYMLLGESNELTTITPTTGTGATVYYKSFPVRLIRQ